MSGTDREQIEILHVDDDPEVRELVEVALERNDDAFSVETVASAEDALSVLGDRPWDCLLSDYDMSGLNGLEFLQRVREEYPEMPFILFTGKGSEGVASEAISAGVTDYFRKQRGTEQFELLANRIRNAVQARRSAQRADRQEQLMRLTEFAGDIGGFEVDVETGDLFLTDGARQITGFTDETDLSLEDVLDCHPPADREAVGQAIDRAVETGEETNGVWRYRPVDGTDGLVDITFMPETDGDATTLRGSIRDVTEEKERQRELQRKTRAIEEAPVGITLTDPTQPDNPLIYANDKFSEITGYSREETVGRNCRFLQGAQTSPEPVDTLRTGIDAEEPVSVELLNYRKDGSKFWNRLEIAPVRDETGAVVNYVGFQQDVTDRVERERALEESRNRYRTLVENFPNGAVALVDENLRYTTVGGTPLEGVDATVSELTGKQLADVLPRAASEAILPAYRAALAGEERTFEESIGDRTYQIRIVPVRNDDGEVFAAMGVSQDITGRKQRERALEKRERILRELHAATREFYPPESEGDIAEFLVEFVGKAFGFEYVSVAQYDEDTGRLQPAAHSQGSDGADELGPISPGSNPIWEVYRRGESAIFDGDAFTERERPDVAINQALVVPIGDFGVTLAYTTGDSEFDDVDMELIEVVAANAESSFQRLRSDRVRTELVEQLAVQQARVDELRSVIDAIQAVQRRFAESDSRDELERGVCEELLGTDGVDFVWIGRPQGRDTDLRPSTWAGDENGYLDSIGTDGATGSLPARRAAADRDPYSASNIASLVVDKPWAKDALSAGFASVMSVPLVYDDVLYGVLTAYSRDEDAFGQMYEYLFTDVASLLVNYRRLLEQRYGDSQQEYTEFEFELVDSSYPLQRLAAEAASRIRFDTVTENMADEIRVLVTVLDGDAEQVFDAAASVNSIDDVAWFGDREHRQLTLTVQKPFLASVVGRHGGELVHSVSDESRTRLRVELPKRTSKRPLLDALSSRYREITPVAQRQRDTPRVLGTEQVADILTDRQYEIVNAAYHGGYYETPRRVTGEDLAETFDISSPAIYNHLQSAHRTLLETVLESPTDITDEIEGLNR